MSDEERVNQGDEMTAESNDSEPASSFDVSDAAGERAEASSEDVAAEPGAEASSEDVAADPGAEASTEDGQAEARGEDAGAEVSGEATGEEAQVEAGSEDAATDAGAEAGGAAIDGGDATAQADAAADDSQAADSGGDGEAADAAGSDTMPERPAVIVTPSSGDGTDVIVDGDQELAIDGVTFTNWRARKGSRTWPGNVVTQDAGWPRASTRPIDTIVIHETGAPSGFSRTDGGVHFLVNHDAAIYQLADLKYRFHHASNGVINNKSIGIELANDTYLTYGRQGDLLPIQWRGAHKTIRLPSPAQLEAMVTLLDLLMQQYHVTSWLNATIARGYFLLATNGLPIDPQPSGSAIHEPVEVGGLVTHSIIKEHGDGGFVALYAWLRLSGGHDPTTALREAKRIAGGVPVDAATVGRLIKTPNAWAITMMKV